MLFLIRGSSKIRTAHQWSWWLALFSNIIYPVSFLLIFMVCFPEKENAQLLKHWWVSLFDSPGSVHAVTLHYYFLFCNRLKVLENFKTKGPHARIHIQPTWLINVSVLFQATPWRPCVGMQATFLAKEVFLMDVALGEPGLQGVFPIGMHEWSFQEIPPHFWSCNVFTLFIPLKLLAMSVLFFTASSRWYFFFFPIKRV